MMIDIKKIDAKAILPTYGSEYAAGMDLYARIPEGAEAIPSGGTVSIGTGIAVAIPKGCFGAVFARSGLATKNGLRPANCVGVIDSDYRGEIVVPLYNDRDIPQIVQDGTRVAQLVIIPFFQVELNEVDELDETERGVGGFGSTGTR